MGVEMKGVIMAGGFGTRLKPLTIDRPKPMVPVANRPIMEHGVNLLRRHGITDLIAILYFQPEHITSYFGDGSAFGVRMQYVTSDADYGTAGAVRYAGDLLGGERIMVISGDVLTDFDLAAIVRAHEQRGAEATITLTAVDNPLAFGIVVTWRHQEVVGGKNGRAATECNGNRIRRTRIYRYELRAFRQLNLGIVRPVFDFGD